MDRGAWRATVAELEVTEATQWACIQEDEHVGLQPPDHP